MPGLVVNSEHQTIVHANRLITFSLLWLAVAWGVVGYRPAAGAQPSLGGGQTVITNAAMVRNLKPGEAARQLPVQLRGVVTYVFDRRSCFVQDQSAGIFVGNGEEFPDLSVGDVVMVQ
jgi:hypothetical protein